MADSFDDAMMGKQPRYMRVANEIAREIKAGTFPLGSLLPSESQLVDRFQVSRATVREALKRLASLGLVSPQHGIGTRVQSDGVKTHYIVSMRSIADIAQYGGIETEFLLKQRTTVTSSPDHYPQLSAIVGQKWCKLEGKRVVADDDKADDDKPVIAYSEIYIRHPYAVLVEDKSRFRTPFYTVIANHTGQSIVRIEQEIEAAPLNAEQAMALNCAAGDAGMTIVRRYYSLENEPVEVTLSVYPAGRFTYRLHLQLETV